MRTLPVTSKNKGGGGVSLSDDELGLVTADLTSYQEPLVVGIFGGPGSGKSRFLASAPGDIGLIPTESKSRQTVLHDAAEFGKQVILPSINGKEVSLIRTANPMMLASIPQTCIVIGDEKHKGWTAGALQDEMQKIAESITITSPAPECCQRHYYRWHVNRVKHFAYLMLDHPTIRTIGFDTFGTFVDDVSYANYGITGVIDPKEYGFAPREDMIKEIREFLNNMSRKNLVLTHHSKGVWRDGKPVAGKTQEDGKFSKLGHYVAVMVEMTRDDKKKLGDEGYYTMKVKDCQANPVLIGEDVLKDVDITFADLAMKVYPDSDEMNWI